MTTTDERRWPFCAFCGVWAGDLYEYQAQVQLESPETLPFEALREAAADYCRHEEGTLDPNTGAFLCTKDYVNHGMPSSPEGWKATPENLDKLLGLS